MSEVFRHETGPQARGAATYQVANVITTANVSDGGFSTKINTIYTAPEKSTIWRDYSSSDEFGVDETGVGFSVWIDHNPEDREEGKFLDMDLTREAMFELHAWLSEKLYGVDNPNKAE